jgi:hypothetical protein
LSLINFHQKTIQLQFPDNLSAKQKYLNLQFIALMETASFFLLLPAGKRYSGQQELAPKK